MITHTEVVELLARTPLDDDELLGYGVVVTHTRKYRHGSTERIVMLPEIYSTRSSAYSAAEGLSKTAAPR